MPGKDIGPAQGLIHHDRLDCRGVPAFQEAAFQGAVGVDPAGDLGFKKIPAAPLPGPAVNLDQLNGGWDKSGDNGIIDHLAWPDGDKIGQGQGAGKDQIEIVAVQGRPALAAAGAAAAAGFYFVTQGRTGAGV
jgi:hypothetical protein